MKIALTNNYYYLRGGSERIVFEEQKILQQNGHQVVVFSQALPENVPSPYSHLFPPATRYQDISWTQKMKAAVKIIYNSGAMKAFSDFLDKTAPEIIHVHNIYGGLTTSILDVACKRKIPVVMTVHDYKLVCPSYLMLHRGRVCEDCRGGRFSHCLFNRCHKDSLAASLVYSMESYFNKWFDKYGVVRNFICPSLFSLNKHLQNGMPQSRLTHVPNFIFLADYGFQKLPGDYILFAGRLSPEKGILTLLEAAKDLDIPIKVAGDGPLRNHCLDFVNQNNMTHITFAGHQQGKSLQDLFQNAAFVVFPSQCFENAPMTVLEAFAYGKPVIGSHIGGIPEMITPHETGLLCPAGDIKQWKESMQYLFTRPCLIEKMGRLARDKVTQDYNSRIHYEKLIEVYQRCA
ncbi:MAG: glycosyltransferase family 4 protein [Sedimentisphaerales bacterium]|nr:glycosyltransferase family 4 protein [Sedimentisphaerales bacterium]